MYGTILGNLVGIGYFLAFQLIGVLIALRYLRKENIGFGILLGSVLGSFMISWLPILCALFLKFSVRAHVVALIIAVAICFFYLTGRSTDDGQLSLIKRIKTTVSDLKQTLKNNPVIWVLIPLFVLIVVILDHHTISEVDGAFHAGQSTYGDMNMHLGFITSIAKQKFFPPEYSILPGTRLAYPFLSDSISSSVYIWGASLRVSYMLPMFFAFAQVFFGMVAIGNALIGEKTRKGLKVLLAFVLFFFNGGFGIWYFIHPATAENFTRIFTAFYETPTNYIQENVYWHNVICDMLIPQRATLFGWAVLFPLIALLLRSRKYEGKEKSRFYLLGGILAGGLPLIHTHSFLALGVLCAGTLFIELLDLSKNEKSLIGNVGHDNSNLSKHDIKIRAAVVIGILFVLTCISMAQRSDEPLSDTALLVIGFGIIAIFGIGFVLLIVKNAVKQKDKTWIKDILSTWGIFLLEVLIFALPQLVNFTFKQAQGEQFVRGAFNWANNNPDIMNNYISFYLKNIGIVFILFVVMLIVGTRYQIRQVLPGCLLWLICEFILFQPNPYDNNKLLLVAYLFFCIAVSDFVCETLPDRLMSGFKSRGTTGDAGRGKTRRVCTAVIVCLVVVLGCSSAAFTIGREYVSDYELYGADYVKLAEWIEDNTEPGDVFLTATNHNNAVASLTGRNIVCGAGTFLYYHGLDYGTQENDVRTMYEDPELRDDLLDEYDVDYIVIGGVELGTYTISDLDDMYDLYEVVYSEDGVVVLAV